MIAGNDDQRCVRQGFPQPLKLVEREEDRGIGRTNRVEDVPRDDDRVRPRGDDLVNGAPEGLGDIRLTLVEAVRSLAMVLTEAEMEVGEMREFHSGNSKGGRREGKRRTGDIANTLTSIQYSFTMPALTRPPARRAAPAPAAEATAIVVGLRRIVRALELYSVDVRRNYGLTAPQLWAVKTLARTGPLTTGQLALELMVHQSSTSLLVVRLERRGLVRKTRHKEDRRFVRIELTERGLALAAEAPEPAQGRLLHGLGRMPTRRVRVIRRAIDDLVAAMEAEGVEARFFFADG